MSSVDKNTCGTETTQNNENHKPDSNPTPDRLYCVHIENVKADDDSMQALVSTNRSTIYGKDVILEKRATQFLGQISGDSLNHLSSDRKEVLLNNEKTGAPGSLDFASKYGQPYMLKSSKSNT